MRRRATSAAHSGWPGGHTCTREGDSSPLAFGTLTGSGSIATASSSFKANGVTNGSGYKMDVNGYFFGPSAVEVGGVFRLSGNGGNGQGALFGGE